MSEAPKKPKTRKAAPKPAAKKPQPETAQKAERKDDAALKSAVLEAALPDAAFDGFTDKLLESAGKTAGLTRDEVARLFPDGPLGLLEFYSAAVDAEMEERLAAMELPKMKIRLRIAEAVKTRLAILGRHKEAARRGAAALSLPMHAGLAAKLLYRTVDAMWRAAGDVSTDFNFYSKRAILAGVYGTTLVRWFADTSEGESVTEAFLAARIENVMQFEKFKAQAKEGFAKFSQTLAGLKPRS